jgi:transcriptional regulator GlxA family with amidase domain
MTRARELLEFSRSNVDEIAATVGHDDASGLIRKEQKVVERPLLARKADVGEAAVLSPWIGSFMRSNSSA